ncbi:GD11226 [Drosophila simulans]|uniref:GD11226 n=1 Tax=Drosophila simulans TaxID=7240 RepID=B4QIH0_DROSI|nr:GD11226 [Drosophila simulans]
MAANKLCCTVAIGALLCLGFAAFIQAQDKPVTDVCLGERSYQYQKQMTNCLNWFQKIEVRSSK